MFKEAQTLIPGGVNSPVRAFRSVGGQPIVFDRVKGPYMWDVDGNKYIDYVGSWGPAIVGHANDEVNAALKAQVDKGTSFGAPCELEVCTRLSSHTYTLKLPGLCCLIRELCSHVAESKQLQDAAAALVHWQQEHFLGFCCGLQRDTSVH